MKDLFSLKNPLSVVLLCVIAVFGVYASTLNAPMHFDDLELLLHNPCLTNPSEGFLNLKYYSRKLLTLATFAVNYQLHGKQTFGYHLVNTILHLLTGLFLWRALLYLFQASWFRRKGWEDRAHAFAVFVTLIFLVHPLQTQAVTYIWERSEVLTGLFYAIVLWCYWKGRIQGNIRFLIYSGFFWFIGLYAKGPVVTVPLLLGLSEVFFFDGWQRLQQRGWSRNLIMGISAGASVVAGFFAVRVLLGAYVRLSGKYLVSQFFVIGEYLQMTFVPIGQSLEHDFFWGLKFWRADVMLSAGALMILLVCCVMMARRFRLAMFGVFWYFIYLLPTSSIFLIGTPIFEHRLYFSLPGFGILLGAILFGGLSKHARWRNSVAVVIIAAFALTAVARNQVWLSQTGLLEDAIRKDPHRARSYWALGGYYMRQNRLPEAEALLRKGLELSPNFAGPYTNFGVTLIEQGKRQEGIRALKKAIRLDPGEVSPYWSLAYYYRKMGRLDLASKYIEKCLDLSSDSRVLAEAADIFMMTGRFPEALRVIRRGLRVDKDNFRLRYLLGRYFFSTGKPEQAVRHIQWCLNRNPDYAPALYDMAGIFFKRGKVSEARDTLERACALEPRNAVFYGALSKVYQRLGDAGRAEFYLDLSRTIQFRSVVPIYK